MRVGVVEKRKNRKQGRRTSISTSTRKMSEMVWEFAGEFIRLGETLGEKQNFLNAVCSAWNIACNTPEVRDRSLDHYVESYRSYNSDASDEEISGIRSTMEKLMQNKLCLFPAVQKQIVSAQITQMAGKDRIDVASASFE